MKQTRDRQAQRTVSVLAPVAAGIDPLWVGIEQVIRVERVGTRSQRSVTETMFGVAESNYESVGGDLSETPPKSPILGNFENLRVPQNGGWGANSYYRSATPTIVV